MIRIRSVALGLTLLAGSAAVAGAQSTTTTPPAAGRHQHGGKGGAYGAKGGRHGMMGGRLFKGIDLSADQKTRIQQIGERYRSEFRTLRGADDKGAQGSAGSGQGARRERPNFTPEQRQQMQALRQRQLTEVRGVLTAEQQKQFDANVAEMKARREAHQKERGARTQKQG